MASAPPKKSDNELLSPEFMTKLDQLEVLSRKIFAGRMKGDPLKGNDGKDLPKEIKLSAEVRVAGTIVESKNSIEYVAKRDANGDIEKDANGDPILEWKAPDCPNALPAIAGKTLRDVTLALQLPGSGTLVLPVQGKLKIAKPK